MFFRGYTLRYAAVIFLSALFLLVAGLLVYMLWFAAPREPPRKSRPVGNVPVNTEQTVINKSEGMV